MSGGETAAEDWAAERPGGGGSQVWKRYIQKEEEECIA